MSVRGLFDIHFIQELTVPPPVKPTSVPVFQPANPPAGSASADQPPSTSPAVSVRPPDAPALEVSIAAGKSRARDLRHTLSTDPASELKNASAAFKKNFGLIGPIGFPDAAKRAPAIPALFLQHSGETGPGTGSSQQSSRDAICTKSAQLRDAITATIARQRARWKNTLPQKGDVANWTNAVKDELIKNYTGLFNRLEASSGADKARQRRLDTLRRDVGTSLHALWALRAEHLSPLMGEGSLRDVAKEFSMRQTEFDEARGAGNLTPDQLVPLAVAAKMVLARKFGPAKGVGWDNYISLHEMLRLLEAQPSYGANDETNFNHLLGLNRAATAELNFIFVCNYYLHTTTELADAQAEPLRLDDSSDARNRSQALQTELKELLQEGSATSLSELLIVETRKIEQFVTDIQRGAESANWGTIQSFSPEEREFLSHCAEQFKVAAEAYQDLAMHIADRVLAGPAAGAGSLPPAVTKGLTELINELYARKFWCEGYAFNLHLFATLPPPPAVPGQSLSGTQAAPVAETASLAERVPEEAPMVSAGAVQAAASDSAVAAADLSSPAASTFPSVEEQETVRQLADSIQIRLDFAEKVGKRYLSLDRYFNQLTCLQGGVSQLKAAEGELRTVLEVFDKHHTDKIGELTRDGLEQSASDCAGLRHLFEAYLGSPRTRRRSQDELAALIRQKEVSFSFPNNGFLIPLKGDRIIEIQVDHQDITSEHAPGRSLKVEPRFIHYHLDPKYRPDKQSFTQNDLKKISANHIVAVHEKDNFGRKRGRNFEQAMMAANPDAYRVAIERERLDKAWSVQILRQVAHGNSQVNIKQ